MLKDMSSDDKFWLMVWGMVFVVIIFLILTVGRYNSEIIKYENDLVSKGFTKSYECRPNPQMPIWSKDGKVIKVKDSK